MEIILTLVPLKTWIFAAGFGGILTVFKTKYQNFTLGKEYEKNLKEIRTQYLYSIREDLKANKDKYLSEELRQYDTRKFEEVLKKIYKDENFSDLISNKVKENINIMNFETHTSLFNILLIGPTGVGKSTLINSVLQMDKKSKNSAKTGKGVPITLGEPHPYTNEKVKGIRLWDSQGIDKSNYGIKQLIKSVTTLINNNANSGQPDNFIHCIWYCLSGHRFEEVERDSLIELMKIYHDETLPIIIVYTQCISEDDEKSMEEAIKSICMEQNRNIDIVSILAEDKEVGRSNHKAIVQKYGIDKLMKKSFEKIEGSVQSACFHSIREQIKSNYKKKITKLHQKIKGQVKEQLSNFNSNISLSDLADKDLKLFELITQSLIFEEDKSKKLSDNSKEALLEFLKDFVSFCSQKLDEFMEKLVIKKSIELATSYHNKQEEIHEKSDKINKGIMNSITNQILSNISLFKTIGIDTGKNNIKFKEMEEWQKISKDEISDEFQKKIEKFFNKGITKFIATEFIKVITDSMVSSFNETFNNIDNYMVKKCGQQVKIISKEIIKQIKGD
jgi:GTPase SAR1 family protein